MIAFNNKKINGFIRLKVIYLLCIYRFFTCDFKMSKELLKYIAVEKYLPFTGLFSKKTSISN